MMNWLFSTGLGWLVWLGIILTFYIFASSSGAAKVNERIQKQKDKDNKKLKEVADEADQAVANGDTNIGMQLFNWFRKQR